MLVGETKHFRRRPMLLLTRPRFVVGGSQPLLSKCLTPRHLSFVRPIGWVGVAFLVSREAPMAFYLLAEAMVNALHDRCVAPTVARCVIC